MPIILGNINNEAVQSGGSLNIAEAQCTSTHSKMNMQGAGGSFNIGIGNLIYNNASGNLLPSVNDPDAADIVAN